MLTIILTILSAVLPPCQMEDSQNCYWDAGTSGNGAGHSFIDIAGTAYYIN